MTMYNENKKPLTKMGVRILRPSEYKRMLQGIDKPDMKTQLQALLYTGMRYTEMLRFQKYPSWFDGEFVHLPRTANLKEKRTQQERWVKLNPQGRLVIEYFIRSRRPLPSWQSWSMNLKRWAGHVDLDTEGLSSKTTRKTYESWLMFYYPARAMEVALSQGHTTVTSLQHYLGMAFNEHDRFEMKEFVDGW